MKIHRNTLRCALESLAEHMFVCLQAGAITGFLAAFTEAPIDFYKSQLQVQVIRAQADPNYKRASDPPLPISRSRYPHCRLVLMQDWFRLGSLYAALLMPAAAWNSNEIMEGSPFWAERHSCL